MEAHSSVHSLVPQADVVKFQVLNLAVKLFISNPKQTSLLFKYVMELAKYDVNHDLRDRARMLRSLFFKKKSDVNANEPAYAKVHRAGGSCV